MLSCPVKKGREAGKGSCKNKFKNSRPGCFLTIASFVSLKGGEFSPIWSEVMSAHPCLVRDFDVRAE